MNTRIYDPVVQQAMKDIQTAFCNNSSKKISVNGSEKTIPYPYPSPVDWRDNWIYFLMIDRFNNPATPPSSLNANSPSEWDRQYEFRQGGNFKGIEQQLDYIASLGAGAIWISPVLKNPKPNEKYNYHGYAAQDFLSLDERFASDGTLATAEKEFTALVEAAHARGLYVIVDIVINHSARVFDYLLNGISEIDFTDANIMNGPLGSEPSIQWLDGSGQRRPDWIDTLPPSSQLSPDDAVWPADLQEHKDFFRRRGSKLSDTVGPEGFVKGDFGALRQLVAEYFSTSTTPQSIREQYGRFPVLNILIEAYVYLIARFDIDGFRMDTVKYVNPLMVEIFGNAIREFALSIGKRNFFTFGEIYDDEQTINNFVGRNTSSTEGFGIDAALDFPLFYKLPGVAKSNIDVDELRKVFKSRKERKRIF
jgi:hypothetical protein